MKNERKLLIVDLLMGLLIVGFVVINSADRGFTILHRLCDGCFSAGVLLMGIAGIIFCSNKGCFNLLGFGVKQFGGLVIPGAGFARDEKERYVDYCMRMNEKEPKPFGNLLITGAVYLAASIIFLIAYLTVG